MKATWWSVYSLIQDDSIGHSTSLACYIHSTTQCNHKHCLFTKPACRCHKSLFSPYESSYCLWDSMLCLYHVWQHVFPQQLCIEDDVESASGMMHARVEVLRMSEAAEGVFSMPATADSPRTALMYPPARWQYAIHSAVIQSFTLASQMVSPMIRLIHCLAPQKVWGFGIICKQT